MKHEALALPGCSLFTVDQAFDPVLGKVFYEYSDYSAFGLKTVFLQHYEIEMMKKNVLRGFYIQDAPLDQEILMRCDSGSVQVTLLDLRSNSETYLQHISVVLDLEDQKTLYFPSGIAYAVLSLKEDSKLYCMSNKLLSTFMDLTVNAFDPKLSCQWPEDVIMSIIGRTAPTVDELPHNYW